VASVELFGTAERWHQRFNKRIEILRLATKGAAKETQTIAASNLVTDDRQTLLPLRLGGADRNRFLARAYEQASPGAVAGKGKRSMDRLKKCV